MIAEKSTLQFNDFVIINSAMNFISPVPGADVDIDEITSQYEIDFDYGIKREGDLLFVFVKIFVNKGDSPKLGYQLFIEGVGILDAKLIDSLRANEGSEWRFKVLNYGINRIRSFIEVTTSFSSFDKYTLPLFNVGDIIRKKMEQRMTKASEKKVRKVKTSVKIRIPKKRIK